MDISRLLSWLADLGKILKEVFLGFLLYNKGVNDTKLENTKKELEDAKEAEKLRDHISSLSDSDLDGGL